MQGLFETICSGLWKIRDIKNILGLGTLGALTPLGLRSRGKEGDQTLERGGVAEKGHLAGAGAFGRGQRW